ncbi:hypothetical protein MKX08_003592 [Trichoderma sp. CBMAI-0020]|nr:hypothetical protein MKX08_003592 [Trichoderma sp. CBMAI-0020]
MFVYARVEASLGPSRRLASLRMRRRTKATYPGVVFPSSDGILSLVNEPETLSALEEYYS